jgi:pimeloyl-ACP methyl ester carboxylesterase
MAMANPAIKLYMIPGTGTDHRMFTPQLEAFPNIIIPTWLPPLNLKEPLESYAKRLTGAIDVSSPFILGGVSLGGMIAQQMALTLKPKGLILISTAGDSKSLSLLFRLSGKLTRFTPDFIVKLMFTILSASVAYTSLRHKEIYAQMLKDMPPTLIRWQSGAATHWRLKEPLGIPVFHIHGGKDPVIPVQNVKAQVIVPDGGHLINITHEKQVNKFIEESLSKLSS